MNFILIALMLLSYIQLRPPVIKAIGSHMFKVMDMPRYANGADNQDNKISYINVISFIVVRI